MKAEQWEHNGNAAHCGSKCMFAVNTGEPFEVREARAKRLTELWNAAEDTSGPALMGELVEALTLILADLEEYPRSSRFFDPTAISMAQSALSKAKQGSK